MTRPVLLHLTHRLPYPPDKGDRIRTWNTLLRLAANARVHLASLADEPVPPDALAAIEKVCERVAVVPLGGWMRRVRALKSLVLGGPITTGAFHSPTLSRLLEQWTSDTRYHAALASSSAMVPYLRRGRLKDVPAVVDLVDVDSQKWFDYAAAGGALKAMLYNLEGRRLRRLEKQLPSWARAVVLTTPAEVAIYESFAGPGTARVVANGVDLDYFHRVEQTSGENCVFVGALDYRPNVDGIVWFCEAVWPKIMQQRRDARLFVVGRRPVPAVQALAGVEGVEVVGTVPDVRPWVEKASVVVVPLRIARGVQNKVLEALAMNRPVVASPTCLGGLGTVPGKHLLAATTADEWVAVVPALFDDPERCRVLGEAGRAFVEEHHDWDRCLTPLTELLLQPGSRI